MATKIPSDLHQIQALLRRYIHSWRFFSISIFLTLLVAFLYIKVTPKVYYIRANVLVKEQENSLFGGSALPATAGLSLGIMGGNMEVQDELHILSSFSVMREAIEELTLHTHYERKVMPFFYRWQVDQLPLTLAMEPEVIDTLTVPLTFTVEVANDQIVRVKGEDAEGLNLVDLKDQTFPLQFATPYGKVQLEKTSFSRPQESYTYEICITGLDEAAQNYMELVKIEMTDRKSNVITLAMDDSEVTLAKNILNTLITIYNERVLNQERQMSSSTAEFIDERLSFFQKQLLQTELQIQQYKEDHDIIDMTLQASVLLEQTSLLQTKLVEASIQHSMVAHLLQFIREPKNEFSVLPLLTSLGDQAAVASVKDYNEVVLERLSLLETASINYPLIGTLETQIKGLRQAVIASVSNAERDLQISLADIQGKIDQIESRFADVPQLERAYLEFKRSQLIQEKLVVFLMEKKEENALSKVMIQPKAEIIDAAYRSKRPVSPNKLFIVVVAFILGLGFPIAFFFFKDLLKFHFDDIEDLSASTDLPIIGELVQLSSGESLFVEPMSTKPLAELLRLIRTNLQFILKEASEKVILITSTRSGEGKSFFAINLALTLAMAKKRVVIVGLDIRSPQLQNYLERDCSVKGVVNYLVDERAELDPLIHKGVKHENLDVVFSGPIPPNPNELLLEDRLDDMVTQLRTQYDYILLDSAPVGLVSDSFVLARLSDATIYVMRAHYTERNALDFAEHLVETHKLKKLSLVLNGTKNKAAYGYGYGIQTKS